MAIFDKLIGRWSPEAALRRAQSLTEQGDAAGAFVLYARAARAALPEAEFRIGRLYLEGSGVPRSRTEGMRWLERAASHGLVEAQSLIATLFMHGFAGAQNSATEQGAARPAAALFANSDRTEPNYQEALKWARLAAESGSSDAQALLGYILTAGPPTIRDLDAAHGWYQRAAAAGSPQGTLGYALSLARVSSDPSQTDEIIALIRRAAEAGLPLALRVLGLMTERGVGMPADAAAAADLYRAAAEKGDVVGQAKWGLALLQGIGVAANPAQGESWLRRAALAGDREAAALIGDLYAKGGGLPPNYAEAAMWFRRAAEAGHRTSARALGMLHLTGAGVGRDSAEAAAWFRRAAEAGDQNAKTDLANLLLQGFGQEDDSTRTREWFEQAAASGDLIAAFNYGVCLAEGVGVDRDDRKAAEWMRRAADGVVNAQDLVWPHAGRRPRHRSRPGAWFRLDRTSRHGRHAGGGSGTRGVEAARSRWAARPSRGARTVHPRRRTGTYRRDVLHWRNAWRRP